MPRKPRHPQIRSRGAALCLLSCVFLWHASSLASAQVTRFAAIGDYGDDDKEELDVSNLVKSWNPEFILTLGDNNYDDGEASTIDQNVGKYYHDFIHPYLGSYGQGADINRFFPTLGNHDWRATNAQPYLDYFTLPGNERYYEFKWGGVHFFALDSDEREPDGYTSNSVQGQWFQQKIQASDAIWKVVYFHHSPYSSSLHGVDKDMQWPFQQWGATIVLSAHDHTYERIQRDGFPYIVNGLGGRSIYEFNKPPVDGSMVRYNGDFGALLVEAGLTTMTLRFFNRSAEEIDQLVLTRNMPDPPRKLIASGKVAAVALRWKPSRTGNVHWYRVHRAPSITSRFIPIATVRSLTFIDDGRAHGELLFYYVTAISSQGLESVSSNIEGALVR